MEKYYKMFFNNDNQILCLKTISKPPVAIF